MKAPNTGLFVLLNWVIKCDDKNNKRGKQSFIKTTKTTNPTSDSRAIQIPPIGDSFMDIETSSNINGKFLLSAGKELILFKLLI